MPNEITIDLLDELRKQLDMPTPHSFTKGLIGGACNRCGKRYPQTREGCTAPRSVSVESQTLRALLDCCEEHLDPERAKSRKTAVKLVEDHRLADLLGCDVADLPEVIARMPHIDPAD